MRRLQGIRLWVAAAALAAGVVSLPRLCGAADERASATEGPSITSIGVASDAAGTSVTLTGDAVLAYEYFLIEGRSLVLDLDAALAPGVPPDQSLEDPHVSRIRAAPRPGAAPGTRIVLDLRGEARFSVGASGTRIVVSLAAEAPAAASAPRPPAAGAVVSSVEGARVGEDVQLLVRAGAPLEYRLEDGADPRRIALLLPGASLAPGLPARLAGARFDANVSGVTAAEGDDAGGGARIVVTLREPAPYRVAAAPGGLAITLSGRAAPAAAATPRPVAAATPPQADPAYSGARISLDFSDADITDIFRLISDVSGRNIVAGEEVQGTRSIKMIDIPWDQALDLLLKTHNPQLVPIEEAGGVIRVTTLKRVADEQAERERKRFEMVKLETEKQRQELETAEMQRRLDEERQAQLAAQQKAERQRRRGWAERSFAISYGDTAEAAARLQKFFSKCEDGCIFEVGERTNTIFVRDFVDNVERMEAVFGMLETPAPAVMVEARIVEVLSDFSQSIGVQWGAEFRADAAHGNATDYAFPNSIAVGGGVEQGPGAINPGTYFVNLPATAPVGGIGLSLGHVANTLSLDMRLSALEKMGKTKILSNPKILVLQNERAKINVGSQLPVPKTDAEGNRTVEWKDVGILLQVTPQVTNDERVVMDVSIEKSAQGVAVNTTEGSMFSIETRNAVTKVLVADGETSVIGGIYIETSAENRTGIPWFQRLPVVGWLFRSREDATDRKELMIFLTPRIVRADAPREAAAASGSPALP